MKKKTKLDEAMKLARQACDMARSLDTRWCNRSMEIDKRFAELEYFPPIREWKAVRDRNIREGEARIRVAREIKTLFEDCPYARKEIARDILKLFPDQQNLNEDVLPYILFNIISGDKHESQEETNTI